MVKMIDVIGITTVIDDCKDVSDHVKVAKCVKSSLSLGA